MPEEDRTSQALMLFISGLGGTPALLRSTAKLSFPLILNLLVWVPHNLDSGA